ncbi:MAG: hypothetical protein HOV80_19080 [Polyangiaceae bacterium]|nr:hypothetical protein [Polyangiaceae bacterium]
MAPPKPSKKDIALALLEQGAIFVHLDPRRDKVVVPQSYRSQPELVLQFGLNMRIAIPDLEVGDEAIAGTLSFARRPFWCWIPWEAVFAIVDPNRRGAAWPEDAPADAKAAQEQKAAAPPNPKRAHLRAVPDEPPPRDPATLEGEGTCSMCSTKWPDDASSCVVCGSSREEAFVSANGAPEKDAEQEEEAAPEPPKPVELIEAPPVSGEPPSEPPPASPPKRPHLRLVKK